MANNLIDVLENYGLISTESVQRIVQIGIGLETDAGFADVGAGPILRNLIQ